MAYLANRNVTLRNSAVVASTMTTQTMSLTSSMIPLGPNAQSTITGASQGNYTAGSWSDTSGTLTLSNIRKLGTSSTGQYQLIVQEGSGTLYLSSNSGVSWTSLTSANGLPTGTPAYQSGAISATGQYILLGIRGDYLYRSTDYGVTFSLMNTASPQVYLPFDGNTTDTAGGSSSVSVTGSVTYVPGPVTGQAVRISNTAGTTPTNYIRGSYSLGGNLTMSFWFNLQSYPASTKIATIVSLGYSAGSIHVYYLNNVSNKTGLYVEFYSSIQTVVTVGYIPVSLSTWYHCHVVYQQSGTCYAYINGSLIGSCAGIPFFNNPTGFGIGTYSEFVATGDAGDIIVDDLRLYNSAITTFPLVKYPYSHVTMSGNASYMMAGTDFGHLFLSSDAGATWALQSSAQTPGAWTSLSASHTGKYLTAQSQPVVQPNQLNLGVATWSQQGVTWTASASSFRAAGYEGYRAFNTTIGSSWATNDVSYNETYIGSTTTTVQGGIGAVLGEWLQLQSSVPLVLQSYRYGCPVTVKAIKNYYIVGSNDGSTWYPLQYTTTTVSPFSANGQSISTLIQMTYNGAQVIQGGQTGSASTTSYSFTTQPFIYFRMIVTSVWPGGDLLDLGEWTPNFLGGSITPNQSGLTTSTWMASGAVWTATASSGTEINTYPLNAFNNRFDLVQPFGWASSQLYNTSTGNYTTGSSTVIQGGIGTIGGEWLQLQVSTPVILSSYTFGAGGWHPQMPKTYYIVGSNDGSTWYPLQYVSMTTTPFTANNQACSTNIIMNYTGTQTIQGGQTGSGTTTSYSSYVTLPFQYFRMVIVSIWSSNTYGGAEIGEWYPVFTSGQNSSSNYGLTWSPTLQTGDAFNITKNATVTSTGSGIVTLPAWTTRTSSGFTISIWFTLNSAPITNSRIFVANTASNQGIGTPFIFISFLGSRVLSFTQKDGPEFFSTTTFNASTLYHVVWTADGSGNHRVYVNGIQDTTGTGSVTATTYPYVHLGKYSFVGDPYPNITYTDFRMFNRALNAAEVSQLYANKNYGQPALQSATVSKNGKYTLTSVGSIAGVSSAYLSNYQTTTFTNPLLSGINAPIIDTATSFDGQRMVIVTAGTTNNVYYSLDYGATFTALTIGSSGMTSCAMSYDGSYLTVSNGTTVYRLNSNSTGYSLAIGSEAGRINQAANAIAIGNQAGTVNQTSNSIVLNATGSTLGTGASGLYVAPIAGMDTAATAPITLLGYGDDRQIVRTGVTVYADTGNVGIGSSINDPQARLHIYGDSTSFIMAQLNEIKFRGDGYSHYSLFGARAGRNYFSIANTSVNGTIGTAGTDILVISGTNVGIGTTTPFSNLTLVEGASIYVGNSTASAFRFHHNSANHSYLDYGTGDLYIRSSTGIATEIDRLSITSGGNVGIGTTNPAANLSIYRSNGWSLVGMYSSGVAQSAAVLFSPTGTLTSSNPQWFIGHKSSNNGPLSFWKYDGSIHQDNSLTITTNGNVGIGITNSNGKLQFSNDLDSRKIVLYEGANNDHQFLGFGVNNNTLRYQINTTTDSHVFYAGASASASTELMRIQGNGRVGIGTNNPGYTLHVIGDIYASGNITGLSDRRYKTQIEPIRGALNGVTALQGYTYFRPDHRSDERQMGLIAQDVLEVYPEAVTYDKENDRYGVNYGAMIAPLVSAVKEMRMEYQQIIQELRSEIRELKDRLSSFV